MTRLFLLLLLLPAGCADRPERPDVLLVTVDTLRADHTSAFGYDLETTPALAALAERGVAFDRCVSQHPETGPSISSILTSRYPSESGVRENGARLPPEFPTLAEGLRDAGYRTGAFVSTYLLKPHASGLHRGFDRYDHEMTGRNLGHDDFERRASETVERALAWLAEDRSRPTFLWVHLYDPHGRYDPGEELASRFYRKTGRPALRPEQIVDYQRRDGVLDPDLYVAHYDGEIRVADRAIGALVVGMGERAVVAVTADHGEGLGEHDYWFRHGSRLDAAALHVPLVIAGPGVPSGKRVERLVMNLDVAPTLLDLALGESFPDARGVSLSGRFDADSTPARVAFSEARRMGGVRDGTGLDTRYKVAATTDRHRLVLWPESGQMALYDLQADPGETIDVSGTTPDVLAALRGQIRRFLAVGDRLPGEAAPSDVVRALEGLGYLGGRSK